MTKLRQYLEDDTQPFNFSSFVLGISGGDCAGKKELINYIFDERDG